jgi:hypothetical protein
MVDAEGIDEFSDLSIFSLLPKILIKNNEKEFKVS